MDIPSGVIKHGYLGSPRTKMTWTSKEKHQTRRESVHGLVYGHPRVDMLTETMLQSMTAYIIDSAATLWYVYYGKSHVFFHGEMNIPHLQMIFLAIYLYLLY